jgi:FAD-linked oxidoreductase
MRTEWRNWSRATRCQPGRIARPRDEAEVAAVLASAAAAGHTVRAVGAGHSFNRLVCTDGTLLDMSACAGVEEIDRDAGLVTVRGGTSLAALNSALHRAGMALPNVGTIVSQTVAGALATGNHGTGLAHGPFASLAVGLRLVTADGTVMDCDSRRDPELFRCARTSLGALGVVTRVTLRCEPAFKLRAEPGSRPLDELLDGFTEWASSADHVQGAWLPWRDTVSTRMLHRTDESSTQHAWIRPWMTTVDEVRCGIAGLASRVTPAAVPWVSENLPPKGSAEPYVDSSHRVFSFPQPVRFLALEHALPLDGVPDAVRALRGALRRFGLYSPYSLLMRVGAADDAPLSPAYGWPTGYVNLTVPRSARYVELLRTVEHVLREHDARPHWGKAHTATAEVLRPRYPEWDTFARMRGKLDPTGLLVNDHLARLLGSVDE